jgi:hypothetical protein
MKALDCGSDSPHSTQLGQAQKAGNCSGRRATWAKVTRSCGGRRNTYIELARPQQQGSAEHHLRSASCLTW